MGTEVLKYRRFLHFYFERVFLKINGIILLRICSTYH